jgi:hypothetical protein
VGTTVRVAPFLDLGVQVVDVADAH